VLPVSVLSGVRTDAAYSPVVFLGTFSQIARRAAMGQDNNGLSMKSLFVVLISATLLAACATSSKAPPPSPEPTHAPASPVQPASPASVAPPGAVPTPAGPSPAGPSPASAADKAQAQKLALHAVNLLNEGREEEARAELNKALSLDHDNVLAASLMTQITADPAEMLGVKSFRYTVKPGDTLSKIAEAFLKDQYKFYILARYNNIAAPRNLRLGQVIRVPGIEPSLQAVTTAATDKGDNVGAGKSAQVERLYQAGQQAVRDGDKDKAYDLFMQAVRLEPKDQRARTVAEQLKPELIAQHDRKAREAFRRQDLSTSIKEWDKVLQLDPNNETARLERQRAKELEKHLEGVN
jgi:tetratricopeptide (TPR) repeat protein